MPEQLVPVVFVVTEVVSIASEKVTEIVEVTPTNVSESDGEVDETVGGCCVSSSGSVVSGTRLFLFTSGCGSGCVLILLSTRDESQTKTEN